MSTPAYITWIVPVRLRDLHKEILNETETALIPAEYEQRLVPDFGNALAVVVPSLPGDLYDYITDAELGAAFTFMLGTKFLRPVSALSSHRMGGDALLGNKWGCIEQVLSMINFYSRIANKPDLVEHEYSKNCFDLNIGYLRPADFELAGSVGDHVTRPTNIELRAQIPPPTIEQLPDLQALAPQRFDEYNHNGHIYRAAYVSIPLRPGTNSDEVNYSFNGLFRVAYEAQHPVTLVEQLWQWSPGKIWVPNNGTNFKLLGLAREGDQLVVSKTCNQHVGVQFEYDGLTPPTITQREAGPIVETTVFESTDTWTFQNCNVRANDLEEGPRDILGEIEHGIGPASSYLIVPPSNSSTQY